MRAEGKPSSLMRAEGADLWSQRRLLVQLISCFGTFSYPNYKTSS
jgi:hypothetical protein